MNEAEEDKDIPSFPEHLITSVRQTHFRVIENDDIENEADIEELLRNSGTIRSISSISTLPKKAVTMA